MKPTSGKVWLVGAGPGDPGLITVKGQSLLQRADVVFYDGLVNPLLLRLTSARCERTSRARRDGDDRVAQEDLNERLIAEARAGRQVVRLKGGDPYIFGRGSEEAAALQTAGIPFEVVPGISAATGAGEYAGFSYTHRELSSAVAFVTGQEAASRTNGRLDYRALAAFPGTLVFYMGLNRLEDICHSLVAHGKAESTPAAVVCHATLSSQKVVEGTLSTLPDRIRQQADVLKPPSLIVVGDCVQQRSRLSWFERLPLFGLSIGITRPDHELDETAGQIIAMGGEPVLMPLVEIEEVGPEQATIVRTHIDALSSYQWVVFSSVNGVREFMRKVFEAGRDSRVFQACRIAVIGRATAKVLMEFGLKADLFPTSFRAESLAEDLLRFAKGQRILIVRASRGREIFADLLRTGGADPEELVVYENRDVSHIGAEVAERLGSETLHWVALSSPAIARRFRVLLDSIGMDPRTMPTRIATLSPVTSEAARECGLQVAAEATDYTWSGLLDSIGRARAMEGPGRSALSDLP